MNVFTSYEPARGTFVAAVRAFENLQTGPKLVLAHEEQLPFATMQPLQAFGKYTVLPAFKYELQA